MIEEVKKGLMRVVVYMDISKTCEKGACCRLLHGGMVVSIHTWLMWCSTEISVRICVGTEISVAVFCL